MSSKMGLTDGLLIVLALSTVAFLMRPQIRESRTWRATVTPLASIIGSGFLVIAPLLGHVAGNFSWLVMLGIVTVAFAIGAVIRFNIVHAEPVIAVASVYHSIMRLERMSDASLSIAYIISIAFYIRLLASFVLDGTVLSNDLAENCLTSAILIAIGAVGWKRGLHGLELLEVLSVSVKLSIIGALLLALFVHDAGVGGFSFTAEPYDASPWEKSRMIAGMLLVVQGFETSRYLGTEYPAPLRAWSMRMSQLVSGAIYVAFIILITPLLQYLDTGRPSETAVIALSGYVATSLPLLLVLAAVMSQFSAAVADTLGAGGLLVEEADGHLKADRSYLIITLAAVTLIWIANIFEIISLASRAFAFYYLMQTITAISLSHIVQNPLNRSLVRLGLGVVAVILAFVLVFAMAVE